MPSAFAPNDPTIPQRLRDRIEGWDIRLPRSQFQQYGPLNAFLSIKFPPANFLVKPQALLRATFPGLSAEDADAVRTNVLDNTMDVGGATEILAAIDKSRLSLDSNNAFVGKEKKTYPDFVVTAYGAVARPSSDNDGDVIRLIVEVGSIGSPGSDNRTKLDIQAQLYEYLEIMGDRGYRWEKNVIGMAIVGTEFAILKPRKEGNFTRTGAWHSLYSAKFTDTIQQVANI